MKQSFLSSDGFILCCLCLATLRIYLEIIKFNFMSLPLTKRLGGDMEKFHKYGLYFSVGYIIFFAPQLLI